MNWILLLIIFYFSYKTYKSWFTLSEKETKIYNTGDFFAVKSKEELEAGCSLENWNEHNENRLVRDEHGNYNKVV